MGIGGFFVSYSRSGVQSSTVATATAAHVAAAAHVHPPRRHRTRCPSAVLRSRRRQIRDVAAPQCGAANPLPPSPPMPPAIPPVQRRRSPAAAEPHSCRRPFHPCVGAANPLPPSPPMPPPSSTHVPSMDHGCRSTAHSAEGMVHRPSPHPCRRANDSWPSPPRAEWLIPPIALPPRPTPPRLIAVPPTPPALWLNPNPESPPAAWFATLAECDTPL